MNIKLEKDIFKGYTIVEVLVSVVLLAIVMIGGMQFFTQGREQTVRSGEVTYALQLAKSGLEWAKSVDYNSLPDAFDDLDNSDDAGNNNIAETSHNKYGITFDRFIGIGRDEFDYRVIYSSVQWTPVNHQREITLHTIISDTD
ncbi:MAG: prepilin-type N-terminal cleavage/methylation domain-containing protein [Elusimicrobiota bacterium]